MSGESPDSFDWVFNNERLPISARATALYQYRAYAGNELTQDQRWSLYSQFFATAIIANLRQWAGEAHVDFMERQDMLKRIAGIVAKHREGEAA